MHLVVLPRADHAARCAASGPYAARHGAPGVQPTRMIATDLVFDAGAGWYASWMARGTVLATGSAASLHDARLMRADLARLTAQISS
jgi:hypothetical protein